jgi:hypothetical protein
LEEDGDMMLYEWGIFDSGMGPSFQFGLTRQFIRSGDSSDDAITQLRLVIHFDTTDEARPSVEATAGVTHRMTSRPSVRLWNRPEQQALHSETRLLVWNSATGTSEQPQAQRDAQHVPLCAR